jgi:c-di-GMP-binding flagellar brake protein YcgR
VRATEERVHQRFTPPESAYVVFRPDFNRVGRIKDIGLGGLGFEFVVGEKVDISETNHIDILLTGEDMYLQDISCKIVWESETTPTTGEPEVFFSGSCGLQFQNMTVAQTAQLERLIEHMSGAN